MTGNLKSLIGRLNPVSRNAMDAAAGLCLSNGHYEVDIEHLLMKLLEANNTDLHRILHQYEINSSRLKRDLTEALEGFKSGNTRTPVLSPRLIKLCEAAWLCASLDFGVTHVRSGHLLLALISNRDLARIVEESSRQFTCIAPKDLASKFADIVSGSDEDSAVETLPTPSGDAREGKAQAGKLGKTPALDQYTIDLTDRARQELIDPVLGRDREIRQMIDILTRRRQNNPILTGEAGVGKTAVVEGLALRIATGDVPPALRQVALHALDLTLLQAGASVKGEFEQRLKTVIEEVKCSSHPIILFIDEAHTMIGAGGQAGQGDAANILKPALARGELRTIAATTWSEYKKYFEKDPALARRFQVVKIEEPTEEQAIEMLRGVVATMEKHHGVRILDDAVIGAVRLSSRYLSGRQLPDKAVSVLDTACARVHIGQTAVPGAIEDTRLRLEGIAREARVLGRESATGRDHVKRLAALEAEKAAARVELAELETRWDAEKALVATILDVRKRLEESVWEAGANKGAAWKELSPDESARLRTELNELTTQLENTQDGNPLVQFCVTGQTSGEVISAWTGVPLGKMLKDEIGTVLKLHELLAERVVGQQHALDEIAKRIRTARANLEDPNKPKGVFLLVGTSGVGKTETALALADVLYGGERNMITINMSEYQEAHTVSSLKGSPPGYVGYGEGGVLTEAVRRRPHSVILLDEVEKAHPDVLELFFQVFDKGMLEDGEGREVDFKNAVIILTSNVGTDYIMQACKSQDELPGVDMLVDGLRPELNRVFKPAFIGRLTVTPYYPIGDAILKRIIRLKLDKIKRRIAQNHGAELAYDDKLVDAVAARCTESDSGARLVDNILSGTLLPEISGSVLARMAESREITRIAVSVEDTGQFRIKWIERRFG